MVTADQIRQVAAHFDIDYFIARSRHDGESPKRLPTFVAAFASSLAKHLIETVDRRQVGAFLRQHGGDRRLGAEAIFGELQPIGDDRTPGSAGAYKRAKAVPAVGDVARQDAFIKPLCELPEPPRPRRKDVFVDAVHPEYQSRPACGWAGRDEKVGVKRTTGRQRMNLHGALCLEDFDTVMVEGLIIEATTTLELLRRLQDRNSKAARIHVFLDNARYHPARVLQPFLRSAECPIKLHFLPPYCPHLNPIERL